MDCVVVLCQVYVVLILCSSSCKFWLGICYTTLNARIARHFQQVVKHLSKSNSQNLCQVAVHAKTQLL